MVSFFGYKLGAAAKPATELPDGGTKVVEFGPLAGLPLPGRPGTAQSSSPYGQLGASSSLVDLRPSTSLERPSTADPTTKKDGPRPGDFSHTGSWPRVAPSKADSPERVRSGSSASTNVGLVPTAAASRPVTPGSGVPPKHSWSRPLDLQLSKDAAAAAMQAPPRSPLGQFEFNLRKQHAASPVVTSSPVDEYEDRSIVPLIEDTDSDMPSSPAPTKALPPTPSRQGSGDARPKPRPRAPSNLREVIHSNESSPAHDTRVLSSVLTKSPPRMVEASDRVLPAGFVAYQAKPSPSSVRDSPATTTHKPYPGNNRAGRRMSIERDFSESGPPVFTDNDRPNNLGERRFLPRPMGGPQDLRARSASPRRELAQRSENGRQPPVITRPGGFIAARPSPIGRGDADAGPGGPGLQPRGRQVGPGLPANPRPKPAGDTSSPLRIVRNADSKPTGDRILPRISPPGPPQPIKPYSAAAPLRPGPPPQQHRPFRPGAQQRPVRDNDDDDDDQSPCLEAGPGPSLGSGLSGSLRPSPFPAPLHTAPPTVGRPEYSPISPDLDSPQSFHHPGAALRPPPRAPVRRNFSAPGLHQPATGWIRQPAPISPSESVPTSNETTPKRDSAEDRFSLTSSLYSSDSSEPDCEEPVGQQKVIRPAEAELAKLGQFNFGFN